PGPTREPDPVRAKDHLLRLPLRGARPGHCRLGFSLRRPPEITSHHVTALCRLDLRHETRARITSHHVTALCRLDLRHATACDPDVRLLPTVASRQAGALTVSLARSIRISRQRGRGSRRRRPLLVSPFHYRRKGAARSPRLRFADSP